MDEEIQRLMVSVRADTKGFARDVADMRSSLDDGFGAGVVRAGMLLETTLVRAIRTGKLGFEDLKQVALSVMADIASASIRSGLNALLSGGSGGGQSGGNNGLLTAATTLLTSFLGSPGRATGGPVSPGRAFMVGERGPELFVPTSSGSIAPIGSGQAREVRVSIAINAAAGAAPDMLARSSRQVARAVRSALMQGG
jgi:phage-related minor tail protein